MLKLCCLSSQKSVQCEQAKSFGERKWRGRQKNGRLEEAMTTLLQNQAVLVQTQTAFVHQMRERDIEIARHMQGRDELPLVLEAIRRAGEADVGWQERLQT